MGTSRSTARGSEAATGRLRAVLETAPWLLVVTPGLLLGDAAAALLPPPGSTLLIVATVIAVPVACCGAAGRRCAAVVLAFGFACTAAARVAYPSLPADHVAAAATEEHVTVEGTLVADAEVRESGVRLHVDVQRLVDAGGGRAARGRLLIFLWSSHREWRAGDRFRGRVRLRRPRNFGNPGEFDYVAHLARRGVYATSFAVDDARFERSPGPAPGHAFRLQRLRRSLRRLFHEEAADGEARILRALILGDSWCLPADLRRAFRDAGVSHVLAISGLHVGLVAGSGFAFFRWLLGRSQWLLLTLNVPKTAVVLSLAPVLLYAALADGSAATRRATVMVVLFLGAVIVDRQRHLLVSLAAAAAVVVLSAPGTALEASFQLSFVAVLALIIVLERFWPWWRSWEDRHLLRLRSGWTRLWRPVAVYVVVSVTALAATLPLVAFHFNHVSLMGLAANAVVVPVLGSATVTLGLLAAVFLPLSPFLAAACVWLAAPLIGIGVRCVQLLGAVPHVAFRVVTPTVLELLLVYGALLGGVLLAGRRRRACLAALAAVALVDGIYWSADRYFRRDLRVSFLSVGQGDSAVVEFPGHRVMVVDGGGSRSRTFDPGERLIAPFLWRRKIARIDHLVLTHPQLDHYGGLAFLAEQFAPQEFWSNGEGAPTASFARLQRALREQGTRRQVLRRGERRTIGGVNVVVRSPGEVRHAETNDRSLVLSLSFAGHGVLLAGDVEHAAETDLVAVFGKQLRSTVLKVPHHGSRTSSGSRFLEAVRPRVAVFSVGFRNPFGFPHRDVLARYATLSARALRTDRDGAITLHFFDDGTLSLGRGRTRARPWRAFEVDSAAAEG